MPHLMMSRLISRKKRYKDEILYHHTVDARGARSAPGIGNSDTKCTVDFTIFEKSQLAVNLSVDDLNE